MDKTKTLELLEKNLKDWKETKLSKKPCISNFEFYCCCYMQLVEKLENSKDLTQEEKDRLNKCKTDYEEIRKLPYTKME